MAVDQISFSSKGVTGNLVNDTMLTSRTQSAMEVSMNRFVKSTAALLITESQAEFDALAKAMCEYIRPEGVMHEILAADVIDATWHNFRLQRARTAMMNTAY